MRVSVNTVYLTTLFRY